MSDLYSETPEPEPAPEPEPEPAPGPPPEPDYASIFGSPQFGDAVGQAVVQTLGALAGQEGEGEEQSEFDFYGADPSEITQRLDDLVERRIEARMARYEPTIEQMEMANVQDKIDRYTGELDTIKQIDGLFPEEHPQEQGAAGMVERLATAFLPEMRQLYGDSDRALEGSIRTAADYALPIVKAAHAAGYAARNAELQRLSGAPAPPPTQSGEAQIMEEPADEFEALARYASRHGLR